MARSVPLSRFTLRVGGGSAFFVSHLRHLKILLAIVSLVIVALIVAIIIPSLPSYSFASVAEARAFSHIEGAEVVDELGDTNGPYRLKGGAVSGRNTFGKNFDFDLTFNGHTTNWNRIVSSNTWYSVTIFENRRGNQFAVVRKRTE